MKEIEKILEQIEDCIINNEYLPVETEKVELKPTPPSSKNSTSVLQSICAFLNTRGGILILGIKDNNNVATKNYQLTGYKEDFENSLKDFAKKFTDKDNKPINVSEYIVSYEVRDFMNDRICVIYIDALPDESKYAFLDGVAYKRILTGDHKIDQHVIEAHEEFKEEIKNARELNLVKGATLDDIDVDKLNDYIYLLNREVKTQTTKQNVEDAKPFLTRKRFLINDIPTTLGMLVCGKHVKDFLGWRVQVDGFVDAEFEVAQDKKSLVDNVIPLMEKSLGYILKNIQVGVTIEKSGSAKPEYPEQLLRETINNAIAHRDYSIDKYVNITIKPNTYLEIRNPGSFKRQLLLENQDHEIPYRRIIPDSKPKNPRLADVLKVFDKWEGKSRGMSNLVNAALENKIDLPYYRFYSNDDLGLFIQKGKLVDESFISFINSFDLFIQKQLNGSTLTDDEISILAYLYKSEKANLLYRHTILLTPDNNHFNAIQRLQKSQLIFIHPESNHLYPIFLLNRELMREDFIKELRAIFGGAFDVLPEIYKQTLSLIYQVNNYSINNSISATQAGRLLFYKTDQPLNDIKAFDNFKRKIYGVFKNLVKREFIISSGKNYFINQNFPRKVSLFD
ncbi:MAG: putative DNA binding domain-containing protein [Flavobacterium sp.]|jgi:predicted HTH transcriptional regulator|nr:putative DNA binding domain-containing protein [Flavobacterium sp.]